MRKKAVTLFLLICFAAAAPLCPEAFPQMLSDISSDHVLMRIPKERALLGRRIITNLESFYQFLGRSINVKLPRRIQLLVDWDREESRTTYGNANIIIGMNQPTAYNYQSFLLKESMREMARFGLEDLSQGANRPDYEFLYEGMVEILVNEFSHTSRSLQSAWAIAQFLDQMGLLGLDVQRSWTEFAGNHRSFRNAAPGITFLMTFRDLKGRDRPNKLFEALKRANLSRSLKDAFNEDPSELEKTWLDAVRAYHIPDEIIIEEDEVPQLTEAVQVPEAVSAGNTAKLRFRFTQDSGVLLPESVFLRDERTGKVYAGEKDSEFVACRIPVEEGAAPGQYAYIVTAIDESGDLRRWKGTYTVGDSGSVESR